MSLNCMCIYVMQFSLQPCTVGSHLSEVQLSKRVGYPNLFVAKPHNIFPANFVNKKLALAPQMGAIKCFRVRSTRCIAVDDTG